MKKFLSNLLGRGRIMLLKSRLGLIGSKEDDDARKKMLGRFVANGGLCFDVGANFGNRVEPLLSLGANVVAVDPQPECCWYLRKKFGSKITVINAGAGNKVGKLNLNVSSQHTLSTFSDEWVEAVEKTSRFGDATWNKSIEVEITTLDILAEQYGVPDFVKIDVEGFELQVMQGMSFVPKGVSFEYTTPEFSECAKSCVELLSGLNQAYEFNLCVGEEFDFHLNEWYSQDQFLQYLSSEKFEMTLAGDIYARIQD